MEHPVTTPAVRETPVTPPVAEDRALTPPPSPDTMQALADLADVARQVI